MRTNNTIYPRIKNLLNGNKLVIFLEITLVFLPMYLGLVISDSMGINQIPLWGDVVLLGGPILYLGAGLSLALLILISWLRGINWENYGLNRSPNWFREILLGIGVAFAVLGIVVLLINPALRAIPNMEPRDMSRFDVLTNNLPALLINLVMMWFTAGFLEEFMWRGYLMNRLVDLFGSQTKLTWVFVLIVSAVIFGVAHSYQGTLGMLKTGAVGFVFGLAYLAVGRNLWPLIFAHALIDSIDFITHYLGG